MVAMNDKLLMDDLYRRDLLAWSIANIDLLDSKKWSINDRKWIIEPYATINPNLIEQDPINNPRQMAVRKSTQAGFTTLSIAVALHFMSYWESRVGYMLPRQQDISVFSMTRVDPMINNSPFLKSKLRLPNSTYTKAIGNSFLYFLEGSVEPRSIPLDLLLLDEVDLSNPDHVGTAINRLDASNWKMTVWLSTPTLPATGIDAVYESSDARQWMVQCQYCNHWQLLDWERNVKVTGAQNDPTNVQYVCVKCGKEMTPQDIQEGKWVAEYPSRSSDMVGYHVSQMMTSTARDLWTHFRDPNQSITEFYRKRLGTPYTVEGGSVSREDFFVGGFNEPFDIEALYDGESSYYMGVDQGNQLQILVAKVEPGKRFPKIIRIETPNEDGFVRIGQLMRLFNVRRCVVDGDPNRHPIRDLQKTFPGKVLMADYIEDQRERFLKKVDAKRKLPIAVTINRTEGFDDLIQSIKDGLWQLPGDPGRPLPEVELLIDHVTALRRDIEKRKTQSGEKEVGVWRKLRAEHLAHSMLYLKVAMDMDHGASFRTATIGKRNKEEAVEGAEKKYKPKDEVITKIISYLAEVPTDQLRGYLDHKTDPTYTPPFPLSFKLKKIAQFDLQDQEWVMRFMLKLL